ncbi:MAG: hypothetical protein EWV81_06545 [Microcystis aeruginosa Ma_SC_T_19800800_S464]|uniref:DDE Tnp4 domain-containing protein n=1 Tax=Microcystis aeruginosa Ma_SC_T_19800800_S464 TaxID=2486257 RepID=A0A552E044_MICAE|nr:MAG: hypothetical protein EWV81_06545 [Microcystis aeruginosa Ma_SC_T_19800800_S464]
MLAKDCLNSPRELAVAANFSSSSKIVGLVILPIISSISEEICPNRTVKTVLTPDKKPKNGELTENQIKENKVLSSRRIFVEHLIRVVKVFVRIQVSQIQSQSGF